MENMEVKKDPLNIYRDKTVLITGHTGFKGAWLSIWLKELGSKVIGFSLPKWENDYLFTKSGLAGRVVDERGDIVDLKRLNGVFLQYKPDAVFHLAAQPLVRDSYLDPVRTFNANVMGTANVLECIRGSGSVRSGVMITTDKCYKNKEQRKGYEETDELGGHDPYSASKAAAELVIESYRRSFFENPGKLVASVRSGNNIGGGDYSKDRIIPDCIRSLKKNESVTIRNPGSTRPWQHVLEPLYGYLLLGSKILSGENKFAQAWNFGPERQSIIPVSKLVDLVIKAWGSGKWVDAKKSEDLHEAKLLSLDISKAKKILGWYPRWSIEKAVKKAVDWYKKADGESAYDLCVKQIEEYVNEK